MSMQKAQPLICDARSLTSSSSDRSRPQSCTKACSPAMAVAPRGDAFRKSIRAFTRAPVSERRADDEDRGAYFRSSVPHLPPASSEAVVAGRGLVAALGRARAVEQRRKHDAYCEIERERVKHGIARYGPPVDRQREHGRLEM